MRAGHCPVHFLARRSATGTCRQLSATRVAFGDYEIGERPGQLVAPTGDLRRRRRPPRAVRAHLRAGLGPPQPARPERAVAPGRPGLPWPLYGDRRQRPDGHRQPGPFELHGQELGGDFQHRSSVVGDDGLAGHKRRARGPPTAGSIARVTCRKNRAIASAEGGACTQRWWRRLPSMAPAETVKDAERALLETGVLAPNDPLLAEVDKVWAALNGSGKPQSGIPEPWASLAACGWVPPTGRSVGSRSVPPSPPSTATPSVSIRWFRSRTSSW